MNTSILRDFQICVSVPLKVNLKTSNIVTNGEQKNKHKIMKDVNTVYTRVSAPGAYSRKTLF